MARKVSAPDTNSSIPADAISEPMELVPTHLPDAISEPMELVPTHLPDAISEPMELVPTHLPRALWLCSGR